MMLYLRNIRGNMYLILITIVLAALTFGWWVGIPLFKIAPFFTTIGVPNALNYIFVFLLMGLFFSTFWIPLNIQFTKTYAIEKQLNKYIIFIKCQAIFIIGTSLFAALTFLILIYFGK